MKWSFYAVIFLVAVTMTMAVQESLLPVLYGNVFIDGEFADGAIVTVYPDFDPADTLSDTVGVEGAFGEPGFWKINLNNLQSDLDIGDTIIVEASLEQNGASTAYIINGTDGTFFIELTLEPLDQDTDDDGFNANVDCDDNDPDIHPDAAEICNGVDDNCDGVVDESGDSLCDDDTFCNGAEICAGLEGCQDAAPVDCSPNNLPEVNSCTHDPDSNPLTHDTANKVVSLCDEALDTCIVFTQLVTSACSIDMCGAECESDLDCAVTDCSSFDGCVDDKFRVFTDAAGSCSAACGCDVGVCSDFIELDTDIDGDGFNVECDLDCNDNDAAVNPDAEEICGNGIDDNCNGAIDGDEIVCAQACESDVDGDGICDDADVCPGFDDNVDSDADSLPDGCDICPSDALNDADGDGVCGDVDICPGHDDNLDFDGDGIPFGCDPETFQLFSESVPIHFGWTLFALPVMPLDISTSEQLGNAIMSAIGGSCDVIMRFNGETQMMEDDLLGLDDPVFPIIGTEGYFIHCGIEGSFDYDGPIWP